MAEKATLRDVGMALHHLQTLDKYEAVFEKNPTVFKLRCTIKKTQKHGLKCSGKRKRLLKQPLLC